MYCSAQKKQRHKSTDLSASHGIILEKVAKMTN